jgi:hypothetical protein
VKRPSYCCQQCGEQVGWLGRLLWFIHECNRKANPCESAGSVMGDMHAVESTLRFPVTAGSAMGDMQALQDQKDWLNKKLLQYEDALRIQVEGCQAVSWEQFAKEKSIQLYETDDDRQREF